MTLFDLGPEQPAEVKSRGQRITELNIRMFGAGIHPATRRSLFVGTGETCASCVHHVVVHVNRRYHKCAQHHLGPSRSEHSDIRVSWPACALYEPREGETRVLFVAR